MNEKKRVLWVSEFSALLTGFSRQGDAILNRLYQTDKYILAEHASYIRDGDPRIYEHVKDRWKVYGTLPRNPEEERIYRSTHSPRGNFGHSGQFGENSFSEVVCDFKPDIVCFPPGTKITMLDGTTKPIQDVKIGDEIYNSEGPNGIVSDFFQRNYEGELITIELENGRTLSGTPEHPILVLRNGKEVFINMANLVDNDEVICFEGKFV